MRLLAIGLVVAIAGCGVSENGAAPSATTSEGAETTVDPMTTTTLPTTTLSQEVPAEIVDEIVEKAATDLEVSVEEITVTTASRVVWRDSSLGCPQPGQVYMQVLTDGYHVLLDSPEGQLDYRADLGGRIVTCEDGNDPIPDSERS